MTLKKLFLSISGTVLSMTMATAMAGGPVIHTPVKNFDGLFAGAGVGVAIHLIRT